MSAWAALGIDDVRIFVQWQAIAPANSEVKAPDGFNSADPDSPGYNWSRVDRAVSLVSAAGMRPLLVVTGPGPLWASQVPGRATTCATSRDPTSSASSRRAARCATAGPSTAGSSGTSPTCRCGCSRRTRAGKRCTPYAPHLYRRLCARRLPGDQGGGPHLDRPLRRPRAARRERRRSRTRARCRWPSSARWGASRSRSSAIAAGRARAFSRSAATGSPTTPMPRRARPMSRSRASTRRRSPTCRAWSARSTAPSARAA